MAPAHLPNPSRYKTLKTTLLVLITGFTAVIVIVNIRQMDDLVVPDLFPDQPKDRKKGGDPKMVKVDKTKMTSARQPLKAIEKDANQNESTNKTVEHKIAGLNCERYGGPSEEIAAEMVYWRDIPEDASFTSPFASYGPEPKYLTFEPDEGGFNNIRMAMETAVVFAYAMGRILVLPPARPMYLLWNDEDHKKNKFTFNDFFHFDSLAKEHDAVEIISMDEFLKREAVPGNLKDKEGNVKYPSQDMASMEYEGGGKGDVGVFMEYLRKREKKIWKYLRQVAKAPIWDYMKCMSVIPKTPGPEAAARLKAYEEKLIDHEHTRKMYRGKPVEVDAPPFERMKATLAHRKKLCVFDDDYQNARVIHFMGDNNSGARLLAHFYTFIFFEDWKQDLWTKRFVRDHLRYVDEIQCAAARIVNAVREKAKEHGDAKGEFESFHIRRGDFQYKETRISAEEIYENVKDVFVEGATVFVATDERKKKFFDPLREHYHLYFLDDFLELIPDLNKNFYGMLDQRIASRGRTFSGSYLSTFTGYINRMRGYHSQKEKLPGYEKGDLQSYFYAPLKNKNDMHVFEGVYGPTWAREFPASWRDIDHDIRTD